MTDQPEEANNGFPDDLKADLASKIAELDNAQGVPGTEYRVIRVLKERGGETTELLEDTHGARYVRKRFARHDQALQDVYRALSRVHSPLIARVYSVRDTPEGVEVVQDYANGWTLRDLVEETGPLPYRQARDMLIQIARGVQVLHSCNPPIIHRDLNPSNIVAGPDGPRIIDLGIARRFDPASDKDTHTWGTYGYAAPEQFGFGQSDERTDIFALGMLYWFLLTGTDPDANLEQQLARTSGQDGESDDGEHADRPRIPAGARQVIRECTAVSPEKRFSNVQALITALQWSDDAAADMPEDAPGRTASSDAASPAAAPQPAQTAENGAGGRAAPEAVRPSKRTAATRAKRARSLPAKLWFIASSTIVGVMVLGACAFTFAPWRFSYPEALLRGVLASVGTLLFFIPGWLASTNVFGFCDKTPFLRNHRVGGGIAFTVAGAVLGYALILTATANLSPEYVQLLHANGEDAV
ncbi:MAG: serine/threonine-protein kinase [Eggerthellaceae bacterium]|jgi:hypothetical protein